MAAIAKAKSKMQKGKVPKSVKRTKMDLAKAMSTLGFTSSRWLDHSSGLTPKQELDKAHFSKMMEIMKKKKNSAKVRILQIVSASLVGKFDFLARLKKLNPVLSRFDI